MSNEKHILLVEDDLSLLELLQEELEAQRYHVTVCHDVETARVQIQQQPFDCVVSDIRLPSGSGLSLLPLLQAIENRPAALIITAFGTVQQAVKALQEGADDFLTKPLVMDHFLLTVKRLIENRQIRSELSHYQQLFSHKDTHGLIGDSQAMKLLYHQIEHIALADGPVLIQGESGTGKELVAKALHNLSVRNEQPYVVVNCGGIPTELMESEFFGHQVGAFTGAKQQREGLFQQAHCGTLLLDELGEMPLALQAKLLRVLQDGKIRPVGSDKEVQLDVRVLAATNRNLAQAIGEGEFREDLFYRLETFQIHVPPLCQREQDVHLLSEYFLAQHNAKQGENIKGFTDEVRELFEAYSFPGNVRELQSAVQRAAVFCQGKVIQIEHLPLRMREYQQDSRYSPLLDMTVEEALQQEQLPSMAQLQKHYVAKVLQKTGGNKRKTADILGITRRTLYRWLE